MGHGGKREGAGRKKGVGNLLTKELKGQIDGPKVIKFLQDLAFGKIEGSTVNERKEAAVVLLKKLLPDINRQETDGTQPIQIMAAIKEDLEL